MDNFKLGEFVSTSKGCSLRGSFIGVVVGETEAGRVRIRKLTNTGIRPIVACRIENLSPRKVNLPFASDMNR